MKRIFTSLLAAILLLSVALNAQQNHKPSPCDLKSDMRKLWEDHITWTRNVIFNILDGLPGTTEAVGRLLQNQVDIGNAIKPFYGSNAGNHLTALLHDHITIAADLLTALKNNNAAALNAANVAWFRNADSIAAFLASLNPNWTLVDLKEMMYSHLNLTTAEAIARKTANYAADVTAYENVHLEILEMADMLTEGIVKQFPNKFSGCPLKEFNKTTSCDLRSAMRKLWEDHIQWTRNVIFNILDNLPGTAEAVARLLQNQVDIGDALKPYYGNNAGNHLTALLHHHITIAADLLMALKNNTTAAFNAANTAWFANADSIATFLASLNPNWTLADMKDMMYRHLNLTAAEALARKNANYSADVTAYENVHLEILEMADMLTEGIVDQFPNKFSGCHNTTNNARPVTELPALNSFRLDQNRPNPFVNKTTINYYIPENVKQAQILIYDDMGRLIRNISLKGFGEGSIVVDGTGLRKGIYSYRIIVDGKVLGIKKMIH